MYRTILRNATPVVALVMAATVPGCGGPHVPEPSSPSVSADSEAGKKAQAEDETLQRERRAREAKARRRVPSLPSEG